MDTQPQDLALASAQADLAVLAEVLEQEFEALKTRQLAKLNALDETKTGLLTRLQAHGDAFSKAEEVSDQWVNARERLRQCRDMHFRNVQLLRRQLDAVQGALQSLMGDDHTLPPLYDKGGQVQRLSGIRAYQAI